MKKEIQAMMKAHVCALIGIEVIAQIGEQIIKVSRKDWLNNMEEILQQLEGQELEKQL